MLGWLLTLLYCYVGDGKLLLMTVQQVGLLLSMKGFQIFVIGVAKFLMMINVNTRFCTHNLYSRKMARITIHILEKLIVALHALIHSLHIIKMILKF